MKRILLTTTALTMTAGIAAADVTVTGDFTLGFNDTGQVGTAASNTGSFDPVSGLPIVTPVLASADFVAAKAGDKNLGVYNNAGITFAMSGVLDNGMATSITVDMDGSAAGVNDTAGNAVGNYKFAAANDTTMVEFGSTEYSTITNWVSAGDMATDTWSNQNADGLNVLRAETTVGGLKVSVSTNVATATSVASPDPIALTVGGSLGGASYVIANEGSKMGISVSNAIGGATVTTGYSTAPSVIVTGPAAGVLVGGDHSASMNTSTGVKIAYPMGAIVATASYVMEANGDCADEVAGAPVTTCAVNPDAWNIAAVWTSGATSVTFKTDENSNNSVEGTTTMGAATVSAGLSDYMEDMYLSVSNPIGTGATLMASYAIDGDDGAVGGSSAAADEVGTPDLQEGLTIELKFAF